MNKIFEVPLYPYTRSADQDAVTPAHHRVVIVGAGPVGLAAAIDYLAGIDIEAAAAHEVNLLQHSLTLAAQVDGLRRIGCPAHAVGIFSFVLEGVHPSDLGMLLDEQGIAVRTGHHCTQPLMAHYQLPGTVRASYSLYNTVDDVERLFAGIHKAKRLFG